MNPLEQPVTEILDDIEPGTLEAYDAGCTCVVLSRDVDGDTVRRDKWCSIHGADVDAEIDARRERKWDRYDDAWDDGDD